MYVYFLKLKVFIVFIRKAQVPLLTWIYSTITVLMERPKWRFNREKGPNHFLTFTKLINQEVGK